MNNPTQNPPATSLGKRLDTLMKRTLIDGKPISQYRLEKEAKVPQSTIQRILTTTDEGYQPKKATITKLAEFFRVSESQMRGETALDQVMEEPTFYNLHADQVSISHKVPLISWVQAGGWAEAIDNFPPGEGEEEVSTDKKVGQHAYALRIQGDSMEPKFGDGSVIIVDPDVPIEHRAYVIAKLDGQEVTFKQYMEDGNRRYLKPLNTAYSVIDITEKPVEFCGRVIQVITDVL